MRSEAMKQLDALARNVADDAAAARHGGMQHRLLTGNPMRGGVPFWWSSHASEVRIADQAELRCFSGGRQRG